MAEVQAPFFWARDNSLTCGYHFEDETKPFPVTRAFIEKVGFPASSSGLVPAILVTASFGRRTTTPEATLACVKTPDGATLFAPPIKSYHLDFVFDGHTYQPTPASAETARMFGSN